MGFGSIIQKIKEILDKDYVEVFPQRKGLRVVISIILTLIITAIRYYISYPAINVKNEQFWSFILGTAITYAVVMIIVCTFGKKMKNLKFAVKHDVQTSGIIVVICALVFVIGAIVSSTCFNAKKYASLIKINEGNFTQDIEDIGFDEIPMLDIDSAKKLGNAKLGELSDMVSQFEVDDTY